jgi:hypothetical protein
MPRVIIAIIMLINHQVVASQKRYLSSNTIPLSVKFNQLMAIPPTTENPMPVNINIKGLVLAAKY